MKKFGKRLLAVLLTLALLLGLLPGMALAAEPGGKPLFAAKDLRGNVRPAGSARGNVCGSYIHLYFGSNPAAAAAFAEGLRR